MFLIRTGRIYRCQNPQCRTEFQVMKDYGEGKSNPKCCCGAEMKKQYTKPVFGELRKHAAVLAGFER